MREIARHMDYKTMAGTVLLEARDGEDMWHLYNILAAGDLLRCSTFRKIQAESSTGSISSERVRLTMTIRVVSFDYDPEFSQLRVTGQVTSENAYVRVGAHHTMEVEPHRVLSITKDCWDSIHRARLKEALDPAAHAELGAVIMEEGLAHVLLVSRSLTVTRSRVEVPIPRKGNSAVYKRGKCLEKFFEEVLRACVQHLHFARLKVMLIASPGFVKDEFYKYLLLEGARQSLHDILENKSKIVLTSSSSGHRHAFKEIMAHPEVQSRLAEVSAVADVRILSHFNNLIRKNPDRATYGLSHVNYALEMGAISSLLITDSLFRAKDLRTRKRYVQMVEAVKSTGGKVHIFSTQHSSGEQLDCLSGVAAVLRYPLPAAEGEVQAEC